jgi:hypothetical protein
MVQTTLGMPFVIDGPIPAPPKYRLLDVAQIVETDDTHWGQGGQVWGYPPDLPTVWDPCTLPSSSPRKPTGGEIPLPVFAAYTAVLAITCTARGIDPDDIEGYQARALAAFTAVESYAVESELAKGTLMPLNPHFTDANVSFPAGSGAKSPRVGLSYLADAVGATAKQGVIHATPGTVTAWSDGPLVFDKGGVLQTATGVPVVSGDGYIGSSPTTPPTTGKAWAYATGPIKIYRSPVLIVPGTAREALDRQQNVITFLAERDYLAVWDTELQAAVLIDWTI